MYQVRFNLAKGKNFMMWQVKAKGNRPQYFDPETQQLKLIGCTLVSQPATANKIHGGQNKSVCGWIACEDFAVVSAQPIDKSSQLRYNPRVKPYWHAIAFPEVSLDREKIREIRLVDSKVYPAE